MSKKTPEEVLKSVSTDFKLRGVTHDVAAEKMGYGSKQTLSNLLSSKKYLSGYQAKRFNEAFGYNMEYLMSGEGELQPYRGADGSSPLGQMAFEHGCGTFTFIDGTIEGDIQLMLSWIHTLLEKQNNDEGLAVLAEVYRYSQARKVIKQRMRGYKGEFYDMEFEDQLTNLQCEIIDNIDGMLNHISIRKNKKDSD